MTTPRTRPSLRSAALPWLLMISSAALSGCAQGPNSTSPSKALSPMTPSVTTEPFGRLEDGRGATAFKIQNEHGLTAVVTDFGATLVSLEVPDRDGNLGDVVLGFDDVSGYQSADNQYFGCTAGRVCNRLENAAFTLDGKAYALAPNNAPHTLHGGESGFGQKLWTASVGEGAEVTFRFASKDGEEGFPGNLAVSVTYELNGDNELVIRYAAETDAPTLCNLTHHSYFNLSGHGAPSVRDHELMIAANAYTPTDETMIPTGELREVAGSPFDFRRAQAIGARLDEVIDTPALGYDHNYALDPGAKVKAELYDPASGRVLTLETDQPGLQFYSGNFLFGQEGKGGKPYELRSALCLEAQAFPAAPSHSHFPSIVLRPAAPYTQTTTHRFSTR